MFTNEGRAIIDAVKEFIFELFFIIVFSAMALGFGIVIVEVSTEKIVDIFAYILIIVVSGTATSMIKDEYQIMTINIDKVKKQMKTKEETI